MDLKLRDRTALITGGSKGIGLAIARTLAAEGCHLHLAARTAFELDKVAQEIRAVHGVTVTCHPADLSDGAQVKKVAATAGAIDILVNSAGGIPRGTLTEIDEERWRRAWDLKVFGCINLTREIYEPMCRRGSGVIINIVGISGDRPDAYYIAGSAANAALIMFSRSLGGDSIRHGVRVVAVNPGPVETEKHIRDTERLAQERFGDKSRWRDVMAGLPMKRAALPAEVSAMVAFLASDHASYISGSAITIDGGLLSDAAIGVKRG
ncbi:MAG: SDR family NAD(P)-dependent oxidoreductase [Hyphomicrobiales bacterium]|nr:SDR family NAD(P)-dependent oxidoreductase [Hyphomicrobiales bacterium]